MMRRLSAALALLWLVAVPAWAAITLGQVEAQADARLGVVWPAVQAAMAACLASTDGCYTNWSTGGAPTPVLCNTAPTDNSMCIMNQVDSGIPVAVLNAGGTTCSVVSGGYTFASQGITLPATDIFAYRISTYSACPASTPLCASRGVQACVRAKYNGTVYERCAGNGPQAAAFTHDWAAVTP